MKPIMVMMAHYNRWANKLVMDACAALSEDEYHRDLGAYFGSVHGTVNHLYVADRIWMCRFTKEGEAPASLDETPFDTVEEWREARTKEDERIIAFVERQSEDDLAGPFLYHTMRRPLLMEQPLSSALYHFFNHQTHHRGQVHAFLTMLGKTAPALDLIYFQRETGMGMGKSNGTATAA